MPGSMAKGEFTGEGKMFKSSCGDYEGIKNLQGLGAKKTLKNGNHISQESSYHLEILGCDSTKMKRMEN